MTRSIKYNFSITFQCPGKAGLCDYISAPRFPHAAHRWIFKTWFWSSIFEPQIHQTRWGVGRHHVTAEKCILSFRTQSNPNLSGRMIVGSALCTSLRAKTNLKARKRFAGPSMQCNHKHSQACQDARAAWGFSACESQPCAAIPTHTASSTSAHTAANLPAQHMETQKLLQEIGVGA